MPTEPLENSSRRSEPMIESNFCLKFDSMANGMHWRGGKAYYDWWILRSCSTLGLLCLLACRRNAAGVQLRNESSRTSHSLQSQMLSTFPEQMPDATNIQ